MASRPPFKQENSFGAGMGPSYEMKSMGSRDAGTAVEEVFSEEPAPIEGLPTNDSRYRNTYDDQKDMWRLNKKQELRRNFRFLSIFGYSLILVNGWVLAIIGVIAPLTNGGTAGAIWGYLIVICGLFLSTLSMAEMASMAPTAGGQYHWVSEFAPKNYQKVLSYITGWLCVLGWQTALCSTAYSGALSVQGIISLNLPNYSNAAWQGVLLTIAIVLSTIAFNTILLRKLPTFEGIMFTLHIFAFVAVIVVLWVMGDRAPASETFTQFSDYSGWGSYGTALFVGTLAATGSLVGSDCSAHLAEETQDASWVLPRTMVLTAITNYAMCFFTVITIMTVKGSSVDDLLSVPYQPYIKIFQNVTRTNGGATALTSIMFILLLFGIINQVTTTSRQLYAFARDKGLPFSGFLSHVRPGWDVPLNAVTVTLCFSILVSFIIIGSPVAFFTLASLCQSALYASYFIVIGCVAYRKITKQPLPPSRFDLGKAGLAINILAMAYLALQFVLIFFPTAPHPTAEYFNWAVVVFVGTVIIAFTWYFVRGRHEYLGPVEYVRKTE
ncbi:hypothetical protein M409DRAFT_18598 [Zasmidium cellare ATCC 36951]|uniref:Amino acid permease/ SLC12A domain-containing protein n=1 Tax=Zasmidium cellare ATCC 36951 TaxID=1080233 RepID=A0A6A6CWJ7_ZASCE|nr:uncharacterized protein M409DRAFT_18598 [Zasmidium cellare ATCC 36951]KAF2171481.1 hypothetical protein M409DRAFT_18598 [Zasmidium cellare ATCC 36951]